MYVYIQVLLVINVWLWNILIMYNVYVKYVKVFCNFNLYYYYQLWNGNV